MNGGTKINIINKATSSKIGHTDEYRCFSEQFKDSIYVHRGKKFQIISEIDGDRIYAQPIKANFKTSLLKNKYVNILGDSLIHDFGDIQIYFAKLKIREEGYGYTKEGFDEYYSKERIDFEKSTYHDLNTEGFYIALNERLIHELNLSKGEFCGGLHAVEHAVIALMPTTYVKCSRDDIGGVSTPSHSKKGPTIFVYDGYEYGMTICSTLVTELPIILYRALERIKNCTCKHDTGCPACILSPKCGNENDFLSKKGAIVLLEHITKQMGDEKKLSFNLDEFNKRMKEDDVVFSKIELSEFKKWFMIKDLRSDSSDVSIVVRISEVYKLKKIKDNPNCHHFCYADGTDDTGTISMHLYNEVATQVKKGKWMVIKNGYSRARDGELALCIGKDPDVMFYDYDPREHLREYKQSIEVEEEIEKGFELVTPSEEEEDYDEDLESQPKEKPMSDKERLKELFKKWKSDKK